ncbi:MAG: DNA polymerase III subunit delta' [Nocardioidaceae bacterium]
MSTLDEPAVDAGVWGDLVGQEPVVSALRRAVDAAQERLGGGPGTGMTHAWLLTGPPGSGRSNAARAFAAALLCERGGCGECNACRTALSGAHPDVTLLRTERLSLQVDDIRELVRGAVLRPTSSRWQVIVIEDADRLTDQAADALLKSLEEPAPRTVWLLCAPTPEDVLVTIRSRCRALTLRTPSIAAITTMLVDRDGVDEGIASFAARASQGHVGRARALARDEEVRNRRREVCSIPNKLVDLGACMVSAANLFGVAEEAGQAVASERDAEELEDLEITYGIGSSTGSRSVRTRGYAGALTSMKKDQERRKKRAGRDSIDGALIDLLSVYRDVLVTQTGAEAALVNAETRDEIASLARRGSAEQTLGHIQAVLDCRAAVQANAAPLLALEAMMIRLGAVTQPR